MSKIQSLIKDLKRANNKLKEILTYKSTEINRDATIQRFEFVFELAWKTMQEYIKEEGFKCDSPKSCIREAGRLKIIDKVEDWFKFLESRNFVSHIYNEKMAKRIYIKIKGFPAKVEKLLKEIK